MMKKIKKKYFQSYSFYVNYSVFNANELLRQACELNKDANDSETSFREVE